jgi:hypothetical protein
MPSFRQKLTSSFHKLRHRNFEEGPQIHFNNRDLYDPKKFVNNLTWMYSLEYPYFLCSVPAYSLSFIIYALVFTLTDNHDAIAALAIPFHLYGWGFWIYQLYVIITQSYHRKGSRLFSIPILLYITSLYQFVYIYTLSWDRSNDVFIGMEGNFSRISILGLSTFLYVETNGSLGTGSIFGNTGEVWGMFTIALNSIAAWVYWVLVVAVIISIFDDKIEERLKLEEEAMTNGKNMIGKGSLFYSKYNQWLYHTRTGRILSYCLSLEYPYFITSVSAYLLLSFLPFTLIFSLTHNSPAIITFGVINVVWASTLWSYQLYLLLTLSYKRTDVTVLSSPAFLFLINWLAFAIIYSVIRHEDPNAFIGFIGEFSNVSIEGLGLFLSSETSTGLGTGATFANNTGWVAFLMVAINSIFFTVLGSVNISTLMVVFSPHGRLLRSKMEKK